MTCVAMSRLRGTSTVEADSRKSRAEDETIREPIAKSRWQRSRMYPQNRMATILMTTPIVMCLSGFISQTERFE